MERKLEKHWNEFCQESIKKSLKKFKKNDSQYRQFMAYHEDLDNKIAPLLENDYKPTAKDARLLKAYIMNIRAKEAYETPVIYSQGICDGFSLLDKFK